MLGEAAGQESTPPAHPANPHNLETQVGVCKTWTLDSEPRGNSLCMTFSNDFIFLILSFLILELTLSKFIFQ